jgi:hypothetical protein
LIIKLFGLFSVLVLDLWLFILLGSRSTEHVDDALDVVEDASFRSRILGLVFLLLIFLLLVLNCLETEDVQIRLFIQLQLEVVELLFIIVVFDWSTLRLALAWLFLLLFFLRCLPVKVVICILLSGRRVIVLQAHSLEGVGRLGQRLVELLLLFSLPISLCLTRGQRHLRVEEVFNHGLHAFAALHEDLVSQERELVASIVAAALRRHGGQILQEL